MTATRYDEIGGVGRSGAPAARRATGTTAAAGRVGDDRPVGRGADRDRVGPLEVGLVEAGEEAVRLERLEVRVDVLRAVLRVDEVVEAVAAAVVLVLVGDLDLGRRRQQAARAGGSGAPAAPASAVRPLTTRRSISPPRKSRKRSPSPVTGKRRRASPPVRASGRPSRSSSSVYATRPTRAARAAASARVRTSARAVRSSDGAPPGGEVDPLQPGARRDPRDPAPLRDRLPVDLLDVAREVDGAGARDVAPDGEAVGRRALLLEVPDPVGRRGRRRRRSCTWPWPAWSSRARTSLTRSAVTRPRSDGVSRRMP